ncbi:MAG: sensor histidine kinase [Bacteroidia bacterium]
MSNSLQYTRRQLLVMYMAWWVFWGLTQVIVLHLAGLNLTLSAFDGLVSTGLLSMISFATIVMYRFFQPGRSNSLYRFLNWIVFTALYCMALKWILSHALHSNRSYLEFLEQTMPVRFVFSLLITSFIAIVNWLLSFVAEQKEKEKKQSEIETMMREAELAKLRQQLQPHFLFNSLNSINALVNTKPQEARKMVQQLSDFLRGTLKKDDQQLTTLKEELTHLQLYLEIEKVRFGHRLNIDINAAPESLGCTLPSLILQPIVENAIKFGLYDTVGEITIRIAALKSPEGLKIEVQNPFDPQTGLSAKGTGFGLSSVQRRLYLVYARQDLLLTEKNDSTFTTILKIPN